jgi:hypothetical protein
VTENVVFLCNWYIYLDVAFETVKNIFFWVGRFILTHVLFINFRDFHTFDRVGGACINLQTYNRWNNDSFKLKKGLLKLSKSTFTCQLQPQFVLYKPCFLSKTVSSPQLFPRKVFQMHKLSKSIPNPNETLFLPLETVVSYHFVLPNKQKRDQSKAIQDCIWYKNYII